MLIQRLCLICFRFYYALDIEKTHSRFLCQVYYDV